MTVGSVNSVQSFTGKYQLNANQQMSNLDECLKRDALIGFWSTQAKDGGSVADGLQEFYKSERYKNNPNVKLDITLELPDNRDAEFEQSMKSIGQKFNKVV